jgi:hypothetical protein
MDHGSALRETAGTIRDDTATNTLVDVNGPRHQRSQRRVVRAAMPVDRRAALAVRLIIATMLATITTAPTYTRRPRNRTDGGVARRRHPSRPQQRLNLRWKLSATLPIRPPRGLRG